MTAKDKAYLNAKPDIGIFGQALNWGGGAKGGDDLTARAKKNGSTNDRQMWRDSGALTANEIAHEPVARRRRWPRSATEQKEKPPRLLLSGEDLLLVCVRPPARAVFSSQSSFESHPFMLVSRASRLWRAAFAAMASRWGPRRACGRAMSARPDVPLGGCATDPPSRRMSAGATLFRMTAAPVLGSTVRPRDARWPRRAYASRRGRSK